MNVLLGSMAAVSMLCVQIRWGAMIVLASMAMWEMDSVAHVRNVTVLIVLLCIFSLQVHINSLNIKF